MNSSKSIKKEWLRSFFDDESHVSFKPKRIVLNIVNKKGLIQIMSLLEEFGIVSRLGGPYKCREYYSYHLTIYQKYMWEYHKLIGYNHPKKKLALNSLIK